MTTHRSLGFTLIEVLIALSILAIALTALLKASAASIVGTQRILEKNTSHLVAMQGLSMIQLKLVPLNTGQETTKKITVFDQVWYWHALIARTNIPNVEKITITTSKSSNGPFHDPLIGFRGKV